MTATELTLTKSILEARTHKLNRRVQAFHAHSAAGEYGPRFIRWRARHLRVEVDELLAMARTINDEEKRQCTTKARKRATTLRRKR